jgi:hypothetical protein
VKRMKLALEGRYSSAIKKIIAIVQAAHCTIERKNMFQFTIDTVLDVERS